MNCINDDSVRSQLLKPPSLNNQMGKRNYGAVGYAPIEGIESKEVPDIREDLIGDKVGDKKDKKNKHKKKKKNKKNKKNGCYPDDEVEAEKDKKCKRKDGRKEEKGHNTISDDLVQTFDDLRVKGEGV